MLPEVLLGSVRMHKVGCLCIAMVAVGLCDHHVTRVLAGANGEAAGVRARHVKDGVC